MGAVFNLVFKATTMRISVGIFEVKLEEFLLRYLTR